MTKMKVGTLTEGVHSGNGGGICSDSFRVIRQLLSGVEDEKTGRIVDDFQVDIPKKRIEQNSNTCKVLKEGVWNGFPLVNNHPMGPKDNLEELSLNRGWRASLTVTGIDGIPPTATGGNVLRPSTTIKLSFRLPPTFDDKVAFQRLKKRIDSATPPDCQVEFSPPVTARGWNAPESEPWLESAFDVACETIFKKPPCYIFEGGSIPFLGMLQDMFPAAQLYVTSSIPLV